MDNIESKLLAASAWAEYVYLMALFFIAYSSLSAGQTKTKDKKYIKWC